MYFKLMYATFFLFFSTFSYAQKSSAKIQKLKDNHTITEKINTFTKPLFYEYYSLIRQQKTLQL